MTTKIIFDCDPGLDDAVALLAAFASPDIEVLAITAVAGNVPLHLTAYNARVIREVGGQGAEIPVCAGAPRPILREAVTAEDFHGSTGLGGIPFPEPKIALSEEHAVNKIIALCRAAKSDPLTIVITGPMTNVALALIIAPDLAEGVKEVVIMGGADREGGNITPFAEFNIFADPHAAEVVFQSGLPIRVLDMDVTHRLRTSKTRLAAIRALPSLQAKAAADLLEASCILEEKATGIWEAPLHDQSTVLAILHPELFSGRRADVSVVTEPGERFGQTQVTYHEAGALLWYDDAQADEVYAELTRLMERYG
ncbi:MAG: nucleoside hydrolase [Henriciella sp.]|nr:nucleoside hydrolase [Henriciella sp.]